MLVTTMQATLMQVIFGQFKITEMKKILILVFMLIGLTGYSQQVGDAVIKTYGDTYLNTNNVGGITGLMLNTYLNYMISSKVNHDSATVVRIATTKDTLFITYWGFAEDTIPLATVSDSSLWSIASDITYSKNSGAVRITAGDLYPSADDTYDLGTSIYGWDTLFLSSVIEYGTDLMFSHDAGKMKLTTAGHLGIGDNSPDSSLSTTGGKFTTDILVGGGWGTWVPTIVWTGGTPSAPTATVARYSVTNNTVEFSIYFYGTNDSGTSLTSVTVTPPIQPPDINTYTIVHCAFAAGSHSPVNNTRVMAGVDMMDGVAGNRIIKTATTAFSITNTSTYNLVFTGTYEITSK